MYNITVHEKNKRDQIKKIKTLKNSNSKEYWKYLNSDTEKPSCQVPINELYNFFQRHKQFTTCESKDVCDDCNMQNPDINEPIKAIIFLFSDLREIFKMLESGGRNKNKNKNSKIEESKKKKKRSLITFFFF